MGNDGENRQGADWPAEPNQATPHPRTQAYPASIPKDDARPASPENAGGAPARSPVDPQAATSILSASEVLQTRADAQASSTDLVPDRDHYFDKVEHTTAVARLRWLLPWSSLLWGLFFFVDVVVAYWVAPSPLGPYAVARVCGATPLLISWFVLSRTPQPSPALIVGLDLTMLIATAGSLSAICVLSGGLASPYNAYLPLVLIGRAAVLPSRWQVAIWRLGVPVLINPVTLGLAALLDPAVAAQWRSPTALGTYFFFLMLITTSWLLLVVGGHHAWALRRQVFASRSLGRYRLERRIGSGGMGEVWQAFHEQLKRRVAVKILRPGPTLDPLAVQRFEREILATAELRHPNTIRIYEHGVTPDGLWYYAMEFLEGTDLATLVREHGSLPPKRAIHLLGQTARALQEAHAHNIIHRDVKPENVFVTAVGTTPDFVKLLDFGIVRREEETDQKLTTTGFVAGTPAYVAPEAAAGKQAGPGADVYGLGAMLYFTLTGTPPFSAANVRELFLKHLRDPVEPLSKRLGRPVPPDLEAVVARALAKNPADRYAEAGAFADALEACSIEPLG